MRTSLSSCSVSSFPWPCVSSPAGDSFLRQACGDTALQQTDSPLPSFLPLPFSHSFSVCFPPLCPFFSFVDKFLSYIPSVFFFCSSLPLSLFASLSLSLSRCCLLSLFFSVHVYCTVTVATNSIRARHPGFPLSRGDGDFSFPEECLLEARPQHRKRCTNGQEHSQMLRVSSQMPWHFPLPPRRFGVFILKKNHVRSFFTER